MKFRAERTEFAEAAGWALRTVGARATLPALSGVKMEVRGGRLLLWSTDLEVAGELSIAVQAERDGAAVVPGKLLGDVVRSLPQAAVEAEVDGDRLHLSCGRAKFVLRLLAVDEFPSVLAPGSDAPFGTMKSHDFARVVAQVARAAGTDEARPVLTGVSLEGRSGALTAAATDSYRLAVRTVAWEDAPQASALVPRRALVEAQRAAEALGSDVRLVLEPSQATFSFGERRLTTRLIEGKFPDYQQLIPTGYERRLVVDRAQLVEVVKRVSVVGESNTTATPVTLHVTADSVRVTAGSGEVGQAEEAMPGVLEGEDLDIAFNPRYLADGLDATGGEEVVLEFRDELKPAVLRPAVPDDAEATVEDFLYLLMPVRL